MAVTNSDPTEPTYGYLYDYLTGERLGLATSTDLSASLASEPTGAFERGGRVVYVEDEAVIGRSADGAVTIDLGTLGEADVLRIIDACRYQAVRHTLDESTRFETLAHFVQMRLNLARRAAHASDPVVIER